MAELPEIFQSKFKVSTIDELDNLLLEKLMDIAFIVEVMKNVGLDETVLLKSATYIEMLNREI